MSCQFRIVSSKTVYTGRVYNIVEEKIVLPSNNEKTVQIVQHPGAVVIIPQDKDGSLLLVSQYRHAIRQTILEFPAGTLEKGEAPIDCAKREICEEVGFESRRWTELGILYPAPGFCNEIQYLFLAQDLSPKKLSADDDELIQVQRCSIAEIEEKIRSQQIVDAKSLGIFIRARLLGLL